MRSAVRQTGQWEGLGADVDLTPNNASASKIDPNMVLFVFFMVVLLRSCRFCFDFCLRLDRSTAGTLEDQPLSFVR